jgi:hypothetical protein
LHILGSPAAHHEHVVDHAVRRRVGMAGVFSNMSARSASRVAKATPDSSVVTDVAEPSSRPRVANQSLRSPQ